ncbi:MAG: hypothetical protein QOH75_962, partial [Actinomycetota bacterium]|nr:hypothetical protein [Actinomycetota bacterium]
GKQEYGWGTYFSNLKNASLTGTTVTHDGTEAWPPSFLFGAGGGASPHVLQPWYQQGKVGTLGNSAAIYDANGPTGKSVSYASQPRRVVPDVAMDADPYTGLLIGETFTKSSFGPNNFNQDGTPCTDGTAGTEYCESSIGGTSLASPLFAGVVALVDQARFAQQKPPAGFLNPALYDGTAGAGLVDVLPPTSPAGFVRLRQVPSGLSARFVTLNSTVNSAGTVTEGADTTLRTTQGYDDVTGLGTPDVPTLIAALS